LFSYYQQYVVGTVGSSYSFIVGLNFVVLKAKLKDLALNVNIHKLSI